MAAPRRTGHGSAGALPDGVGAGTLPAQIHELPDVLDTGHAVGELLAARTRPDDPGSPTYTRW